MRLPHRPPPLAEEPLPQPVRMAEGLQYENIVDPKQPERRSRRLRELSQKAKYNRFMEGGRECVALPQRRKKKKKKPEQTNDKGSRKAELFTVDEMVLIGLIEPMVKEDGTFLFLINHVGRERIPKSNKVAAHLPKIPAGFNELRKWKKEQAHPWLEAMCKEFNKLVNEKKIKIEDITTIKKRIEAKSPEGKIRFGTIHGNSI